MFFFAGLIGGRTGRSAMETVKMSFGQKGGLLFAFLNVLQLVGWTAIMIYDGALAVGGEAGHALVLVGQTDRAVDHEQRHVGAVDGAHRANEAVVLHVLVDLAFAAQARCVNDAVLLTVVDDHRIDGVTRGARHIRDDGAVVVGEAVGERGLARIRAADDGDVDDVLVVFFILEAAIDFAQVIDYLVEQIARAMTVRGGDGERVAQAQLIEFPQLIELVGGVELVDREQNRLGSLA